MRRRREEDSRDGRFESQMRMHEAQKMPTTETYIKKKLYTCSRCHNLFEERSRHCPKCDSLTMGQIKPIRENDREHYQRQSINRIKRSLRS